MAERNLSVPYQSQHGQDSKISNNDCGAASLAMALTSLGTPTTTGEVLGKLGNPQGFINFSQLANVANKLGYPSEIKTDVPFSMLKNYIDRGFPVIVVGGYGYLSSTQDKNFKASHIMLVVGYRDDDSVYVNDPNFWGEFLKDGDHHVYTYQEFTNFWRNDGNKEGNSPNSMLVVMPKPVGIQSATGGNIPLKATVTADIGVRARTEPKTDGRDNIAKTYKPGTVLEIVESVKGSLVSGNDNWFKIKDSGKTFFVWAGAVAITEYKQSTPLPPPPPAPKAGEPAKTNIAQPVVTEDYLKGMLAIYKMSRDILKSNNMLPTEEEGFWGKLRGALKI